MTAMAIGLDREVRFGPHRYAFHVRPAGSWDGLAEQAASLHADNFGLIYDAGLPPHLVKTVAECFAAAAAPITYFAVPASEKAKTPATAHEAERAMLAAGFTRRSVVVALGGGLSGNVAGYTAHHIYRGVRLAHVPTTLLAMLDSTLSLKQGLNYARGGEIAGKNVLGAFHAPTLVWCDLSFLDTLPAGQITAALGELCKNVLAIAPDRYQWALDRLRPSGRYQAEEIVAFIDFCVTAKQSIMRDDPHEHGQGLRNEYGHTVGHALEAVTGGRIPHGDAVARGVLIAAQVAMNTGYLNAAAVQAHWQLLAANGLRPPVIPADVPTARILAAIRGDNKRGYHTDLPDCAPMVLLEDLGQPRLASYPTPDGGQAESLLTQVPFAEVAAAIDQLREGQS
jgi:3-dehydroquinate synthase/2-deoxy-scyllo-inosose synthase